MTDKAVIGGTDPVEDIVEHIRNLDGVAFAGIINKGKPPKNPCTQCPGDEMCCRHW